MHTAVSDIAIVCALLFLEEAGLPLPVAPGEAVLIGAGLLIAGGGAPVWLIVPLAYLAVICGVLTGYVRAHRIGPKRVHALAVRLQTRWPSYAAPCGTRSRKTALVGSPLQPDPRQAALDQLLFDSFVVTDASSTGAARLLGSDAPAVLDSSRELDWH